MIFCIITITPNYTHCKQLFAPISFILISFYSILSTTIIIVIFAFFLLED